MSLAIEKSSISSHIITVYTNVLRNGSFSNSTPACLKEVVKTSKEASNSFQTSLKTSFKCVAVGSILKASISLHMWQFFHPIIESFLNNIGFYRNVYCGMREKMELVYTYDRNKLQHLSQTSHLSRLRRVVTDSGIHRRHNGR